MSSCLATQRDARASIGRWEFLYLMYKLRELHLSGQLAEFAHRRPAASSDYVMYG
eukprot:COSAG05_NODE_15530_length_367_cov_0.824627_1_plen_54_part_10